MVLNSLSKKVLVNCFKVLSSCKFSRVCQLSILACCSGLKVWRNKNSTIACGSSSASNLPKRLMWRLRASWLVISASCSKSSKKNSLAGSAFICFFDKLASGSASRCRRSWAFFSSVRLTAISISAKLIIYQSQSYQS